MTPYSSRRLAFSVLAERTVLHVAVSVTLSAAPCWDGSGLAAAELPRNGRAAGAGLAGTGPARAGLFRTGLAGAGLTGTGPAGAGPAGAASRTPHSAG